MRITPKLSALLALFAVSACSILNRTDPEKNIRSFMDEFKHSLTSTDAEILSFFSSNQTRQALLSAIHVLQNKDSLHVRCAANFEQAQIMHDSVGIKVVVPAVLSVDTLDIASSDTTKLGFYLKPIRGKLTISRLEGEEFFQTYVRVKNTIASTIAQREDEQIYVDYYAAVKFLQQTYDSVVYATRVDRKSYFYVVKGGWPNGGDIGGPLMGLVDKDGRIILPVKFHQIGTIGIAAEDVIEVKLDGMYGYYSLSGKELIPPEYNYILPYHEGDVFAIVKTSEGFGYFSESGGFHEGFPSVEGETYMKRYTYLSDIEFNGQTDGIVEIPSPDQIGAGTVFPPSYLVENGFFDASLQFMTNYQYFRVNLEDEHHKYSFTEDVFKKVGALVTIVEERYAEGRESFYSHNRIDFIDQDGTILATSNDEISGGMEFKTIDSTYLEIKSTFEGRDEMDYLPVDESETNLPSYHYFELADGGHPTLITSFRRFPFTEFVKMDESYIEGNFSFFNHATQNWDSRSQLCDTTLMDMRNEILASNGYIFPDEATNQHFQYFKWYSPRTSSLDEVRGALSEVETFNLLFIERRLGIAEKKPA